MSVVNIVVLYIFFLMLTCYSILPFLITIIFVADTGTVDNVIVLVAVVIVVVVTGTVLVDIVIVVVLIVGRDKHTLT